MHACTHALTCMNAHTHTRTHTNTLTHTKPTPSISTGRLAAVQRKLREKQTCESLPCHSWVCSQSSNVHNSFNGTNLNLWHHQFSQGHGLSIFPGDSLQGVDCSVVAAPGQVVTGTLWQPLKTGGKINKFSGHFLGATVTGNGREKNQQIQWVFSGSHLKWVVWVGGKSTNSAGTNGGKNQQIQQVFSGNHWKLGGWGGLTNSAMFSLCRIRGYLASGSLNRDPAQS